MIDSMRTAMQDYDNRGRTAHPGLWFERFLQGQGQQEDRTTFHASLVNECSRIEPPELYAAYFARWLAALDKLGVRPRKATVIYRLAAGHGGETVIETGIRLHHTYGVPIIPGSSLKGVAASYAAQQLCGKWAENQPAFHSLFGTTSAAGHVTFFDALPLPGDWKLLPDVITVHHPDYYQAETNPQPPADWDSPTPIPFLAVRGTFLIALRGPEAWASAGYSILERALYEFGVGGKTSSGYGRLKLQSQPLPQLAKGAVVRAVVDRVVGGDVELSLIEPLLMGIPPGVELNVYIPREETGNHQWAVGREVRCFVLSLIEDRDEEPPVLHVLCRRAKQEEH